VWWSHMSRLYTHWWAWHGYSNRFVCFHFHILLSCFLCCCANYHTKYHVSYHSYTFHLLWTYCTKSIKPSTPPYPLHFRLVRGFSLVWIVTSNSPGSCRSFSLVSIVTSHVFWICSSAYSAFLYTTTPDEYSGDFPFQSPLDLLSLPSLLLWLCDFPVPT